VLDVARQTAVDANYCMATGLHDTLPLPNDDNSCTSPSGCSAVYTTPLDMLNFASVH